MLRCPRDDLFFFLFLWKLYILRWHFCHFDMESFMDVSVYNSENINILVKRCEDLIRGY